MRAWITDGPLQANASCSTGAMWCVEALQGATDQEWIHLVGTLTQQRVVLMQCLV